MYGLAVKVARTVRQARGGVHLNESRRGATDGSCTTMVTPRPLACASNNEMQCFTNSFTGTSSRCNSKRPLSIFSKDSRSAGEKKQREAGNESVRQPKEKTSPEKWDTRTVQYVDASGHGVQHVVQGIAQLCGVDRVAIGARSEAVDGHGQPDHGCVQRGAQLVRDEPDIVLLALQQF
jgi:hypothetical protein